MTPKIVIISLIEIVQFLDMRLPQFYPDELKLAYLDRLLFQSFHPSQQQTMSSSNYGILSISANMLLRTGLNEDEAIEIESHVYKLLLDHLAVVFKNATFADLSCYSFVLNPGWDLRIYIPVDAYREDLHGPLYSPYR